MQVPQQSMCIFKAGLSSVSNGWSKYKNSYDVLNSNQYVQITLNTKLKLTERKDLLIKSV